MLTQLLAIRRGLVVAAITWLLQAVPAQGTYYVNGLVGLDTPTNGTSAASPWKTIGYAMANVPPQTVNTSAIIFLEGNQEYSPTTNGESFPITPAYNVWLEGTFLGHGQMPVLRIPAAGTGFLFPANEFFFRNKVTYRYLVIEDGDYGMRMGSDPGYRHRPRVQDCTFRNQAIASVAVRSNGASADDPRFFQTVFEGDGSGIGIEATASVPGSVVAPDVEECHFRNLASAVRVRASLYPGVATAIGLVRSCNFKDCDTGVHASSLGGSQTTLAITVERCRFANCDVGVQAEKQSGGFAQALQDSVTVSGSAFLNCVTGIQCTMQQSSSGGQNQSVRDSTFMACGIGIECRGLGVFSNDRTFTNLTLDGCTTGILIDEGGDPAYSVIRLENSRLLRCQHGLDARLDEDGGELLVASTVIAQCQGTAVTFYGFPGDNEPGNIGQPSTIKLYHTTIADNAVGLALTRDYSEATASSSIFAGNTQPLQLAANVNLGMSDCCFENTNWGPGNLNLTDPQLMLPFYKLSPTSPCIDLGASSANSPTTDYEGDPRASISTANGTALPDIGADEYVYAGSARPYGTGGFGAFNVFPRISAASPNAAIGGTVQVDLTGAVMPYFPVSANLAILSLGWRDDSGALPFDLAQFGMTGSYLWNEFVASFALQPVDSNGTASFSHVLPNLPGLVGMTFTHQWFVLMPGPYGVIGSDGLRVTIGQ